MLKEQWVYRVVLVCLCLVAGFIAYGNGRLLLLGNPDTVIIETAPTNNIHALDLQLADTDSTDTFIQELLTHIYQVNRDISLQRQRLLRAREQLEQQGQLSATEQQWLKQIAADYHVDFAALNNHQGWQTLLKRVNTVPASLALAQAANESAWGQSRFARLGNNYFGQWCYNQGCGIVPSQRKPGRVHEVKRYESTFASVQEYVHNLNTNVAYATFRELRAKLVAQNDSINGLKLVIGIMNYNPSGLAYVRKIKSLITAYHLLRYDDGDYLS